MHGAKALTRSASRGFAFSLLVPVASIGGAFAEVSCRAPTREMLAGSRGDKDSVGIDAGASLPGAATPPKGAPESASTRGDANVAIASVPVDAGASAPPSTLALLPPQVSTSCKLLYGPELQAFRGPAALRVRGSFLELVLNDSGKPRIERVAIASVALPAVAPRAASAPYAVTWPGCALAGNSAYCLGRGGAIFRTVDGSSESREVGKGRPATRLVAAVLAREHTVVGYLSTRQTAGDAVIEAWAIKDTDAPVRISEQGSGATWLEMLPRAADIQVLYLDARSAMTPVHARVLSLAASSLSLQRDAVVFVGGPAERHASAALTWLPPDDFFGLIPLARDIASFGMMAVKIGFPATDDVPGTFSPYPNGLDPAPVVGASLPAARNEDSRSFVLRVRPKSAEPDAVHILELGEQDRAGVFSSLGFVSEGKPYTELAMIADPLGALWILYGDASASWLERRLCSMHGGKRLKAAKAP
jgi:hypothetical protein